MQPDVSVVVPTHRGRPHLFECLDSLARQTMHPGRYEVVVVLNGPSDGSEIVLARVRRAFPQLRLRTVTLSSAGVGRARNAGLAAARGDYVTFVDDDDLVSPEFLSALWARSGPTRVGVATVGEIEHAGDVPDFRVGPGRWVLRQHKSVLPVERLLSGLGFTTAKLMPTELARAAGFPEDLRSGEDVVFWARVVARMPFTWGLCPAADHAVYLRRVRPNSVSRQAASYDFSITQRLDVIERLLAVRPVEEYHERALEYLVTGQASLMNRYLRAHPEEHAAVVEDIRSRDLEGFPFPVLNRGIARDLVILYAALPYSDTSALVAARRIRAAQVPVDVVSSDFSSLRATDPGAQRIWHEFLDATFETRTRPTSARWPRVDAFCRQGLAQIEAWQAEKGEYRSVYSRAMWPAAHVLAARYKARYPGVRWIAEFSDPLIHNIHGEVRTSTGKVDPAVIGELRAAVERAGFRPPEGTNLYIWIETLVYALADEILFTNEHQRDYMLGYVEDRALAERGRRVGKVLPHPTLPPQFYRLADVAYEVSPDRLDIAYFGVFYATRGLTEVVAALGRLTPQERRRVRLHVFTVHPQKLAEEARQLGLDDVIVANPYVGYLEFLRLTTRFDLLLVNDARTADTHELNPYMPSKYSDYAGSGTPVWGVVEPGSQLSRRPLAYRSELGDVDGAVAVIRAALADHGGGAEPAEAARTDLVPGPTG